MTRNFQYNSERGIIKGKVIGEGSLLFIAFHGFANSADYLFPLANEIGDLAKIYIIDLPFHGETNWSSPFYTATDIIDVCEAILEKEHSASFSLIGFSMGGRIAAKLVELIPTRIDRIYLISPDGFNTKWIRHFDKFPQKMRYRISNWSKIEKVLLKTTRFLSRTRVIDDFPYKFFKKHLSTPTYKNRLFGSWISLKHFNLNLKDIQSILEQQDKEMHLIFGNRDKLVKSKKASRKGKILKNAIRHELNTGHRLSASDLAPIFKESLR
jgi:pimeloyl-ACP methyl ester carboxylesterase